MWPHLLHEPDYRRSLLEVNIHPPFEYRFWICLKCSNDFQTVTTMPFQVDIQCDPSSTTIYIPDSINTAKVYQYHSKYQEWEGTIDQNTIYYEFDDFTSSTPACPIIQYSITDISVVYHLEKPDALNTKYAKRADGKYVY